MVVTWNRADAIERETRRSQEEAVGEASRDPLRLPYVQSRTYRQPRSTAGVKDLSLNLSQCVEVNTTPRPHRAERCRCPSQSQRVEITALRPHRTERGASSNPSQRVKNSTPRPHRAERSRSPNQSQRVRNTTLQPRRSERGTSPNSTQSEVNKTLRRQRVELYTSPNWSQCEENTTLRPQRIERDVSSSLPQYADSDTLRLDRYYRTERGTSLRPSRYEVNTTSRVYRAEQSRSPSPSLSVVNTTWRRYSPERRRSQSPSQRLENTTSRRCRPERSRSPSPWQRVVNKTSRRYRAEESRSPSPSWYEVNTTSRVYRAEQSRSPSPSLSVVNTTWRRYSPERRRSPSPWQRVVNNTSRRYRAEESRSPSPSWYEINTTSRRYRPEISRSPSPSLSVVNTAWRHYSPERRRSPNPSDRVEYTTLRPHQAVRGASPSASQRSAQITSERHLAELKLREKELELELLTARVALEEERLAAERRRRSEVSQTRYEPHEKHHKLKTRSRSLSPITRGEREAAAAEPMARSEHRDRPKRESERDRYRSPTPTRETDEIATLEETTETATPCVQETATVAPHDDINVNENLMPLKTCPVVVPEPRGEGDAYALLDEGATITAIDHDLAVSIGAEGPAQPLLLRESNSSRDDLDSERVTVTLRGENETALFTVEARTTRHTELPKQSISKDLFHYPDLRGLKIECYERARPSILVGTENWEHIVTQERGGDCEESIASWMPLSGMSYAILPSTVLFQKNGGVFHVHATERCLHTNDEDDRRLHELIGAHFRIDALGAAAHLRINEQGERAIVITTRTMNMIDGGYEVRLPWRQDDVTMHPSYEYNAALRRLKSMERKMDANPSFAEDYTAQSLLEKGYAMLCDGSEQHSALCWCPTHFAAENLNKPGKRLVFDPGHRSHGVSMNDHLLKGPDLLLSLPGMTSKIFGTTSSPFVAHSVHDLNARAHAHTHRALDANTHSHDMDDFAESFSSEEEARRTLRELQKVHAAAGFILRAWDVQMPSVLRDVSELPATKPAQLRTGRPESKITWLYCDQEEDVLAFNTAMHRVPTDVRAQNRAPTKRDALSAVMSIYDPLGLLSLYTIRAKIVLQNLRCLQLPWDEPIPAGEAEEPDAWFRHLNEVANLRLPRGYALSLYVCLDLHVPCDASEQANAAVAQRRAALPVGSVHIALVVDKAKVTPNRVQSIPRRELRATAIGARPTADFRREHRLETGTTTYRTDPATVVRWIYNDARRNTPFVAHRLGVVVEGLTFLYDPEDEWPTQRAPTTNELVAWFRQPNEVTNLRLPRSYALSPYVHLDPHVLCDASGQACATVAYWRATLSDGSSHFALVPDKAKDHIERAERALLQRTQREVFEAELQRTESARPLTKASRLYRLDNVMEDDLLRERERINAATARTDTERPIIPDDRHHIVKLPVLRDRYAVGHANRERECNDLRQRFRVIHLGPTSKLAVLVKEGASQAAPRGGCCGRRAWPRERKRAGGARARRHAG